MTQGFERQLAFLLLIALLMLAAGLGLRDPWPADEPRFALIAKEMAESGAWLFPHIAGDLYPDKPPLFFWSVAVFYLLTGSLRVAFLMPALLAGIGVLLLVSDLARRLWSEEIAVYSGAVLLALMQFGLQMKSGQIDGLLCLWTTLSLYGLCRHLLIGPDWRWYSIAGIAAGLGVITKGVGLLPYLIFVPYAFAVRRGWTVTRVAGRDTRWLLAPVASLVVVACWLVPMIVAASAAGEPGLVAYRDNILFHQTLTRYVDSWGHIKPPWYLFTNAVPWLWLPVSVLLPWLIPAWRRDLANRQASVLLLAGWVMLVLLFFSFSAGKRSVYIFPAAPAVALLAGLHAPALLKRHGVRLTLFGLTLVFGILLAAIGIFGLARPDILAEQLSALELTTAIPLTLISIGGIVLAIAAYCRTRRAARGYLSMMLVVWSAFGLALAPSLNEMRSGSGFIALLERHVGDDKHLAFVAWPEQFLLHWQRPRVHFGFRRESEAEMRDATTWLVPDPSRVILLPRELLEPCFDPDRVTFVGRAHRRAWYLAGRDALREQCKDNGMQ